MNSPWNRKLRFAFGSAILALLVVGAISYHGMVASRKSEQLVRHSHEVLENLQDLQSAMLGFESAYRAFVLTGDEAYVESYRTNTLEAMRLETVLRTLTADNSSQTRRLDVVHDLIARITQFGENAVVLRRTAGVAAATDAIKNGTGQTKDFQDIVRQMKDEELRLLALRDADATRRTRQTEIVLLLGSLLGMLITVAAGWSALREQSGRQIAESSLRESEEQYRLLIEGVQDHAIVMLDPQGGVLSCNPGAERMTGYPFSEIAGRNFSVFFSPEDVRQGRSAEILRLAAANGTHEEQSMRVRKDGTPFLLRNTLTALRGPSGNLRGFSVIGHDITESKESAAKYRGLLEAAPDAMVVVDQSGKIVLLNVRAEKEFGYRRDALLGQQVKNIIPEGFAERLIADGTRSTADALAQQIGTGIELMGRRKDESEFPIEIMLSPLESADGILVTAAIRDISVRRQAEQRLAQMEGRYRGLLEAAPDAMVVVDQSGKIVLLNVRAEKEFGYRRDALLGQQVKNIIPEGFAERLIADGTRSTADALAQQIGTGIELMGRRKDGSEFPIEIMLSPLESAGAILVTAAIRDITTRKAAEQNLLLKVEELNRSNQELGQFAYIASHDLQEPLRMVASYTQLLARRYKGKLDSDADEFINFAVDGANRMQRLIHDLLIFSRVGTEKMELQDTSSEEAFEQALVNLRGSLTDSGAVVTHEPLPGVLADETQLVQLFQNLVGNAIKYQASEIPRIHVSAAQNGEKKWTFSVQDNGIGISPQYFEKIFGMFQRLHKREEFSGTGIGLAICKKIVEQHGGTISVKSQVGLGSTFSFGLAGSERKS